LPFKCNLQRYNADKSSAASDDKPKRKPFWVAPDPINGFVPETMDFARMVEADDADAAGGKSDVITGGVSSSGGGVSSSSGVSSSGGATAINPVVAARHATLRKDHSAWEEIDVERLKEYGLDAKVGLCTLNEVAP
jgi:hypothetical protein